MSIPQQGWYPDPDSPALVRWWDGEKWTEHTQPHPHYAGNQAATESSQDVVDSSVGHAEQAARSAEGSAAQVAEAAASGEARSFGSAAEQALASDSVAAVDAGQDQTVQVAAELFRDAQWSAAEAKKDITAGADEAASTLPQAAQDFIGQGDAHQVAGDATAAWPQVDGSALSGHGESDHVESAVQGMKESADGAAPALPGAAALAGLGGVGAAARSVADERSEDISSAIRERQQQMESATSDVAESAVKSVDERGVGSASGTSPSSVDTAAPSQGATEAPSQFAAPAQVDARAGNADAGHTPEAHEVQSAVPRAGRERRARRQAVADAVDPLKALQRPSQPSPADSTVSEANPQNGVTSVSAASTSMASSALDDVTSLPSSDTLDRHDVSSQEARLKEAEQKQRLEVARLTEDVKSAEAAAETAKYELHLITEESSGEEKTLSDAIKLATREAELADQELQHAKSRLENANEELAKFTSIYQERQTAFERAESMAKEAASREQEVTERARKLLAETDEKRQAARKRLESAEQEVMTARTKLSKIAGLPVERFFELSEGASPEALKSAEGEAAGSRGDADASSAGYVSGSVTVPGMAMMVESSPADDESQAADRVEQEADSVTAADSSATHSESAVSVDGPEAVAADVVDAEVVTTDDTSNDASAEHDVSGLPVVPLASEPEAFDASAPSPPSLRPMQEALANHQGSDNASVEAPSDHGVVTAEIVTNDSNNGGVASPEQRAHDASSGAAADNFASFIGGAHGVSTDAPSSDAVPTPPGDVAAHASTAESMGASWPGATEDRVVDLRGVEEELSVSSATPGVAMPGVATAGGAADVSEVSAPAQPSTPSAPSPELPPTEIAGGDSFATQPMAPQADPGATQPMAAPQADPGATQPMAPQPEFADPARPFAPAPPMPSEVATPNPQQGFGFASPTTPEAPSIPQPPVGTYAMEVKQDDAPPAPGSQAQLPPMPAAAGGAAAVGAAAVGAAAAAGQQTLQPSEAPQVQQADGWAGRETIQESSKTQPHKLASRTQRLAAYIIDSIVLTLPMLVVMGIFGSEMATYLQKLAEAPADGIAYLMSQGGMMFSLIVVSLIVPWLYDGLLPAFTGGTFGHKLFGLRVMPDTSETRNLDVSTCLVRGLIKRPLFSMFPAILIFGFLWCFWQPYRQCWHDSAAHSVVTSTR